MRWCCHPHGLQGLLLVLALVAWGGAAALGGEWPASELDVSADFDEPNGASRGAAADYAEVPVLAKQTQTGGVSVGTPRQKAAVDDSALTAGFLEQAAEAAIEEFYEVGKKHGTDKVKFHKYHFIYPRFLRALRHKRIKMLEIGYFQGASARTWKDYLPRAQLSIMDIKRFPASERIPGVTYHRGDQNSAADNKRVCAMDGPFDVILDDGAHTMSAIRMSLTSLLSCVKAGGYYIVEDLHTAYRAGYQGGPTPHAATPNSVMNIFSDLMDVVNRQHFNVSYSVLPGDNRVTGVFCFRHFNGSYSVLPGDNRVTGVYCFRSVCVLEILGNMWKGRRGDGWNF